MYRWILDPQGFRTLIGEPSPELLEAVAERRRRQQAAMPPNRRAWASRYALRAAR